MARPVFLTKMMATMVKGDSDSSTAFSTSDPGDALPAMVGAKSAAKPAVNRHCRKESLGLGLEDFFSKIDVNLMPSNETIGATSLPHQLSGLGKTASLKNLLIDLETEEEELKARAEAEWERTVLARFAEPDLPENIVSNREGGIMAISTYKLVQKLTLDTSKQLSICQVSFYMPVDNEMMQDFFISYRNFLGPAELAKLLGLRFRSAFFADNVEHQNLRVR